MKYELPMHSLAHIEPSRLVMPFGVLGNLPVERAKGHCVLFAAVWREPGVIVRRVLFAAGWREPRVVCYYI